MPETVSFEDAKASGRKRFFTGVPCRNGHVSERYVGCDNACVECVRNRESKYLSQPDSKAKRQARARELFKTTPPEKNRMKAKKFREKNPEKHKDSVNRWRRENWEALKPQVRLWARQRMAQRRSARVSWANKIEIAKIYKEAARLTKETGTEYHVDHEIPLQGANVCGLHIESNLRIVTATENLRKGARYVVH
jgi:hypothetical protein